MAMRATILGVALLFLMLGSVELAVAEKGTTTVQIYQTTRGVHIVIKDLTDNLSNVYARVINPNTGQPAWSHITNVDGASDTHEITIDYITWHSLPPAWELRIGVTDNQANRALSVWKMPMDRALPDWSDPADLDFISEDFTQPVGGIIETPQIEEPGTVTPDLSEHNYGTPAGIIVGAIVGVIALIGAVWCIRRRRTKAI